LAHRRCEVASDEWGIRHERVAIAIGLIGSGRVAAQLQQDIEANTAPNALEVNDEREEFQVVPFVFDPANTFLVASHWIDGTGCPTNARTFNGVTITPTPFTDPACAIGDPEDERNAGLLLVKTGPTTNVAAAGAELRGIEPGTVVTELGFDIRKPGATILDPRGSHCGGGAPRFNVQTSTTTIFVGCNTPSAQTRDRLDTCAVLRDDP